jgi:4-hydroxybutyrate CoA-transferase
MESQQPEWLPRVAGKLISAESAALLVHDGMRVGFGWTAGEAPTLEAALVARADELSDIEVGPLFPVRSSPLTDAGRTGRLRRWCIYARPAIRDQVRDGIVEMAPPLLGLFHRLGESDRQNPHAWDIYCCRTSPPDAEGMVSLGNGVWYSKFAIRHSKMVIFEIDERMPRPFGDTLISIDDADYVVEHEPVPDYLPPEVKGWRQEVSDVIGALASTLVNDGDTLQVGGGTASAAVYGHLGSKNDLGYHAEIAERDVFDLVEAGIINGCRKTLNPGMAVAAWFRGGEEADRILDRNPRFGVFPSDYTNNPSVIAQQDNFIGINACIAVDLTGQVTAESIDGRLYGGPGGQLEFVIGAMLAKNGRSVMCLPSTTDDGRTRIVAQHPPGTVVTTPRLLADYFVTEQGIACLLGKTERDRAAALVELAHPDHQPDLAAAARKLFGRR